MGTNLMNNLGKNSCDCNCGCGSCSKYPHGSMALKLFVGLAVAFFVFLVGVGMGVAGGRVAAARRAMMGTINVQSFGANVDDSGPGAPGMMGTVVTGGNMMFSRWGTSDTRLFGTITKIEGNLITISDNAAHDQVVVSQAQTVIESGDTEVGLSTLGAGDDIVVFGAFNKDNQLVAKIISVQ